LNFGSIYGKTQTPIVVNQSKFLSKNHPVQFHLRNVCLMTLIMVTTPALTFADGERAFHVRLDPAMGSETKTGRLIVLLIADSSKVPKRTSPVDGPFWDDPQPIFAVDANLSPNGFATLNDKSDCFPVRPSQLKPGRYRAQARFDLKRANSNWRREPGNLWSDEVAFEVRNTSDKQVVEMVLSKVVEQEVVQQVDGVEWFEIPSKLLSKFRGREVILRAGIVLPQNYNRLQEYPAIYEVPGFGDDHLGAVRGRPRGSGDTSEAGVLGKSSFRIVLDPEGPNGHSLFANSANNGPCGQALTEELIPALEQPDRVGSDFSKLDSFSGRYGRQFLSE